MTLDAFLGSGMRAGSFGWSVYFTEDDSRSVCFTTCKVFFDNENRNSSGRSSATITDTDGAALEVRVDDSKESEAQRYFQAFAHLLETLIQSDTNERVLVKTSCESLFVGWPFLSWPGLLSLIGQ